MTAPPARSPLHAPAPHDSAVGHVTGAAIYTDDLCPPGTLHAAIVRSPAPTGRIRSIDTRRARQSPGVCAVLTADDIPGDPCIGPVVHDEPVLARDRVWFTGQSVAMVLAETREQARQAATLVRVELDDPGPAPILDVDGAIAADSFHTDPHRIQRGDVDRALASLPAAGGVVVSGEVRTGGQDHFYLETHCALALPEEGGTIRVISSTQHPTEVQRMAARVLGVGQHRIICEVPRMGGGFGGKESQATAPACLAALGAAHTGRPVKVWLSRHEDMASTGGRHPFLGRYRAGFDSRGRFVAFDVELFSDGGWTADLSGPVMDRALFHLDNAYFIEHARFVGRVCRTNKASSTAFRGFGGPQGIAVCEDAIRRGARALGLRPEDVRRASYYDGEATPPRDRTPYGQQVPHPRIIAMHDRLVRTSDLAARRQQIAAFNAAHRWLRRGIGLQPLKFGISFTHAILNQAGAFVVVYSDGTVQLNHGGTEMGQGLHTKMVAVCADVLGVLPGQVRIMRTSTDKVPNTSPTAASSGSDLNGQAVREAALRIRERMATVAADRLGCDRSELTWQDGMVRGPDGQSMRFADLAHACWLERVSLSATGYYATPGIAYDAAAGQGTPFFYFAYGVAVVEVEVHALTGETRLRRVDILHDVGDSLNPAIDLGQVHGGFIQGVGWLTTEEVLHDERGAARNTGPSTYKIPAIGDVPLDFRVELLDNATQPGVIGGSKAVGEPPFMLAIGVIDALEDAISSFGPGPVALSLPATPEAVLRAIHRAARRPEGRDPQGR
ncbi:MAG: xanthine dehydrogenase molybdopterin binding subunit [Deltaproteobacteria bacterium]|nr:MAG: xanthine dehydrogenase molybdopterin binding subunit [Deltaproteobacteria bacterium]